VNGDADSRGFAAEAGLELDCRGMRCPLPVIELAKRVGDVPVGGVVLVLADDPAAAADVPAWCRLRGHDYLGAAAGRDGTPSYGVRRRS
jgi:TusA-related sulfurtransferase